MASTRPGPRALLSRLPYWLVLWRIGATKHTFHVTNGPSLLGPVGVPFGFLQGGHYELTVQEFSMSPAVPATSSAPIPSSCDPGLFLQRFENEAVFYRHLEELRDNRTLCSFELFRRDITDDTFLDDMNDDFGMQPDHTAASARNGVVLHLDRERDASQEQQTIQYQFKKGEEGLYFLLFQVCGDTHDQFHSTFTLDYHYINYDAFGNPSFLTAGEMRLPLIFFFFSMSHLLCGIFWIMNLRDHARRSPATVYKIHHFMSALVLFKFLATFVESLRYHAIRIYGHAEGWTVVYYIFTMIRGVFLFTVVLLLGTGWSIVKPFLNQREKQVVASILMLQVLNQIALVSLEHFTLGETAYARWTAVLHLVDIMCCCAVLLPIVWQVNQLEKSVGNEATTIEQAEADDELDDMTEEDRERALEEGDKGEILNKLRLFRGFYLLVVAYIYATRILVYLFASMLSYKYLWVQYFIVELVTLTFYVTVGFMFQPMSCNPYFSVRRDEIEDSIGQVEMKVKGKD